MKSDKRQHWIDEGYTLFALEGPHGVKVEVLARRFGRSKSGFYHHFADLDVFTEVLLSTHLVRAKAIAKREQQCSRLVPDLLELLVEVKEDLLFQRQLRVHREVPAFRACFERSSLETGQVMGAIWAEGLGLADNTALAGTLLNLALENFYLRITAETLTYGWLLEYVQELRSMVKGFEHRAQSGVPTVR